MGIGCSGNFTMDNPTSYDVMTTFTLNNQDLERYNSSRINRRQKLCADNVHIDVRAERRKEQHRHPKLIHCGVCGYNAESAFKSWVRFSRLNVEVEVVSSNNTLEGEYHHKFRLTGTPAASSDTVALILNRW